MNLITLILVLFLTMDPIGNIPLFVSELKRFPPARRRWIILREMTIALALILVFSLIGEYIFEIIGVSHVAVRLSAGIIIFLTAMKMLFPQGARFPEEWHQGDEPFIVPLAVPAIAGPGLLATVMLFSYLEPSTTKMLAAVGIAWIAGLAILIIAPMLEKRLSANILVACERLMGMILILLGAQRFLEGVGELFRSL